MTSTSRTGPKRKTTPPDPLVAPDVDLSGFNSFMLNVERLLASELVALATPEEGWAALMLWCRSFQQRPPGSLPDDDRVLAAYSKAGARWPEVREMALRGFVKCSDGRLYNRTMAEVVNEAWASRVEHRETVEQKTERQKRWRERQKEVSTMLRERGVTPPKGASLSTLENLLRDVQETSHVDEERRHVDVYSASTETSHVDGERRGRDALEEKGRRREGEEPFQGIDLPSVDPRARSQTRTEAFDRFWSAYPEKVGKDAARKAFERIIRDRRASLDELVAGIERYRATKPPDRPWCHPATWLNQGRWQDEPSGAVVPFVRAEAERADPDAITAAGATHPAMGQARPARGVASAIAGMNAYFEAEDRTR